jgi:hypothetical protein
MNTYKLIEDLEEIVAIGLEDSAVPVVKGNSIRLKNYIIRNSAVAFTHYKKSALAIAKTLVEGKPAIDDIVKLDKKFLKHYNDVITYKETIKNTKDKIRKESRKARLSQSLDKAKYYSDQIEDFIYQ